MKTVSSFFWVCNMLTFLAAISLVFFFGFLWVPHLNEFSIKEIGAAIIFFTYPVLAAWKTWKWLSRPTPEAAVNFLYWWAFSWIVYAVGFALALALSGWEGGGPGSGG